MVIMNRAIIDIILAFYKEHPVYFFSSIIFMSLIPINDLYLSKMYGNMFEAIQQNQFEMSQFVKILGVIAFLQFGYALMDLNDSKQIPLFQQKCKEIFINRIFEESKENYKELLTGDLMSKILRSQHIITSWYSKLTTFIIPHIFEFVFTLGYFFSIDHVLGMSFGLLLFIFIIVLCISPTSSDNTTTKSDKALNNLHEQIDDLLTNYLSVHKEDKLEYELDLLKKKNNIFISLYNKSVQTSLRYRLFLTIVLLLFLFTFAYRCYTMMTSDKMEKSLFFGLIMMLTHLIGNLLWMIDVSRDIIFDYGTIKNSQFLQPISPTKQDVLCNTLSSNNSEYVLQIKNVFFKYATQKEWALRDVNISIKRGEKNIVIGEIGSGKTTLMKMLLRLLKPNKGNIYLNNQCYKDFSIKSFYKKIGFMPQNCVLFNRSIIDNIRYDNTNVSTSQIIETLHKFGIMKHFSNLENGVDSLAGKNGMNLSGGQRQLVWFLKIYFKKPEVIIMDEPTASLDKGTKDLFKQIVSKLLGDKTIIIVTHDDDLLDLADTIFKVQNGTVSKV